MAADLVKLPELLTLQTATDGASPLAAAYIGLMTKTPPTKPPLPPLRERLKLPDNCVDVTGQHKGERLVITATALPEALKSTTLATTRWSAPPRWATSG